MNRSEHLAWAKARALAYLDKPQPEPQTAMASMLSDLGKHGELRSHAGIVLAMVEMMIPGGPTEGGVRAWITGFN